MREKLQILGALIIAFVSLYLYRRLQQRLLQPAQAELGKVYLPKPLAYVGVLDSALFLVIAAEAFISNAPLWTIIVFLLLSLLGIILIIAFVNCRISYDQDGFIHKSFFGIKRKFTYEQVTAIKENTNEIFLYIGNKKVMVDKLSAGGDDFLNLVRQKYQALHNGQTLPKIHK